MKIENTRRLSIVASASMICLGWSQWISPSASPMRWKWLQDFANTLLGQNGYARFLVVVGSIWLAWNLFAVFKSFKKRGGE